MNTAVLLMAVLLAVTYFHFPAVSILLPLPCYIFKVLILFKSRMSFSKICCALQRFEVATSNFITMFKLGETSCCVYVHKKISMHVYKYPPPFPALNPNPSYEMPC